MQTRATKYKFLVCKRFLSSKLSRRQSLPVILLLLYCLLLRMRDPLKFNWPLRDPRLPIALSAFHKLPTAVFRSFALGQLYWHLIDVL